MDNPEYIKFAMQYVEVLTKWYCNSPALHSWILWNEPTRVIKPGYYSLLEFEKYLNQKYAGNEEKIETLKSEFGIGLTDKTTAGDVAAAKSCESSIEWINFSVYNMEIQLKRIRDLVKKINDNVHDPRNKNSVLDAVVGSYLMCADLGLEVLLVDETKILEGALDPKDPLIIPNVFAGDDKLWTAIEQYVGNGGYVIADGLTALKTPEGKMNRHIKPLIDKVFGALEDMEGCGDEYEMYIA